MLAAPSYFTHSFIGQEFRKDCAGQFISDPCGLHWGVYDYRSASNVASMLNSRHTYRSLIFIAIWIDVLILQFMNAYLNLFIHSPTGGFWIVLHSFPHFGTHLPVDVCKVLSLVCLKERNRWALGNANVQMCNIMPKWLSSVLPHV